MLVVRLIPADLKAEFRDAEFRDAASERGRLPAQWVGAAAVVAIWHVALAALTYWAVNAGVNGGAERHRMGAERLEALLQESLAI